MIVGFALLNAAFLVGLLVLFRRLRSVQERLDRLVLEHDALANRVLIISLNRVQAERSPPPLLSPAVTAQRVPEPPETEILRLLETAGRIEYEHPIERSKFAGVLVALIIGIPIICATIVFPSSSDSNLDTATKLATTNPETEAASSLSLPPSPAAREGSHAATDSVDSIRPALLHHPEFSDLSKGEPLIVSFPNNPTAAESVRTLLSERASIDSQVVSAPGLSQPLSKADSNVAPIAERDPPLTADIINYSSPAPLEDRQMNAIKSKSTTPDYETGAESAPDHQRRAKSTAGAGNIATVPVLGLPDSAASTKLQSVIPLPRARPKLLHQHAHQQDRQSAGRILSSSILVHGDDKLQL
jgi:hypothetical protein